MFLLVLDSRFHGNDNKIRYVKASISQVMRPPLVSSPQLMGHDQFAKGWKGRIIASLGEKNPRLQAKTLVCTLCAGRFDSQPSFSDFPS
jgi:hypothetical protein